MRTDSHTLPLTAMCEPWHVCVFPTQINAFFIFIILLICIFIIIFHYIFWDRDYPNICFYNSGSDNQDSCWLPGEQHTEQGYCWTEMHLQGFTKLLRTLSSFKPMFSSGVFHWIFPDTVKLSNWRHRKEKTKQNKQPMDKECYCTVPNY